jgi:hypothetical protein
VLEPRSRGVLDGPHEAGHDSKCAALCVAISEHGFVFSRHDLPEVCISAVPQKEGAGNAGCALHPRSRVQGCTKKGAHEHTGSAEAIRHSLRNGFTAYAVLSPATNSSCHRRSRIGGASQTRLGDFASASLTPATGARTTRFCRTRIAPFVLRTGSSLTDQKICPAITLARRRCRVHRIPSRVRDDSRSAPLAGKGQGELVELICPTIKAEYFLREGWTEKITLIGLRKIVCIVQRRNPPSSSRAMVGHASLTRSTNKNPHGEEARSAVSNHEARGLSLVTPLRGSSG